MRSKYVITVSLITYAGIICIILGIYFTVQGFFDFHNSRNVLEYYSAGDIRTGRYIECSITKQQLLGSTNTKINPNGIFHPACINNLDTNSEYYIMPVNAEKTYYVYIGIAADDKEFKQLIDEEIESVHIYGQFKRLDREIYEKSYEEYLDSRSTISEKYVIRRVDTNTKSITLIQGVLLLVVGVLCLVKCIDKRETR